MPIDVQVGDWIRFFRHGVLYIGTVEYIRLVNWPPHGVEYVLSNGIINPSEVLEVRRSALSTT